MTVKLGDQMICFGSTLARPMSPDDARAILDQISPDRELGMCHMILARSNVPGTIDVHFVPDRLGPSVALAACATVTKRLVEMYGKPQSAPIIISHVDAMTVREQAESIIDFVRAATVSGNRRDMAIRFDNSREVCVRMLTIAFATVAVSPSALSNGHGHR